MIKFTGRAAAKPAIVLAQPEVSSLIRERQLVELTQVELAEPLSVSDKTINRGENRRIQPSPLALKQIQALIAKLGQISSSVVRERSQQYFVER